MTELDGLVFDEGLARCAWCAASPLYAKYHDTEWGFPVDSDTRLFEKICLEGFQAGLSWLTILNKRNHFRDAFAGFEIQKLALFDAKDVERLLTNPGIIRHRGKIEATISNAKAALALIQEFGSLAHFFWRFEPELTNRPAKFDFQTLSTVSLTPESKDLSKELKRRGWRFVGPTTAYAFMQAMGLVNDHLTGCSFRAVAEEQRAQFCKP